MTRKLGRVGSGEVKCLGVVPDEGLKWHGHIGQVRKKCFAGLAKTEKAEGCFACTDQAKVI